MRQAARWLIVLSLLTATLDAAPRKRQPKPLKPEDFPPTSYQGIEDETTRLYLIDAWKRHVEQRLKVENGLNQQLALARRGVVSTPRTRRIQTMPDGRRVSIPTDRVKMEVDRLERDLKQQPDRIKKLKLNWPPYLPPLNVGQPTVGHAGELDTNEARIVKVIDDDTAVVRIGKRDFFFEGFDFSRSADRDMITGYPRLIVREPRENDFGGRLYVLEKFEVPRPADPRKPGNP